MLRTHSCWSSWIFATPLFKHGKLIIFFYTNLFLSKVIRKYVILLFCLPWLKMIILATGVLRRTVLNDWRFENVHRGHLNSQVIDFSLSNSGKNPGERFDWWIDRLAVGNRMIWLAVKACAVIGYVDRRVARWIANNSLMFPVVIVFKVREDVDNALGQFVLS